MPDFMQQVNTSKIPKIGYALHAYENIGDEGLKNLIDYRFERSLHPGHNTTCPLCGKEPGVAHIMCCQQSAPYRTLRHNDTVNHLIRIILKTCHNTVIPIFAATKDNDEDTQLRPDFLVNLAHDLNGNPKQILLDVIYCANPANF